MNFLFRRNRVYLDYASATPVSKYVKKAMRPFWSRWFFNPNGLYKDAVQILDWLAFIRADIAGFFNVLRDEIIFTSGGTESDNLAILGAVLAYKKQNPNMTPHVIVSAIEHPAVLEMAAYMETTGVLVSRIGVDEDGVVSIKELQELLQENTVLVSVMQVNNEIGSVQPIQEISKTIRHFKKHSLGNPLSIYPLFHTDASQGVLYEEHNIQKLGVDLLSCNGGKIYGPKGVGILYKKKHVPLQPLMYGGNQELGMRPGTQNIPLATGMWAAIKELQKKKQSEIERVALLRDFFVGSLSAICPSVVWNSNLDTTIPGIVNFSYPGIESELLVLELDAKGCSVSSKSACKYDDPNESYVLEALGRVHGDDVEGSIRVSIGRNTTMRDIRTFVKAFREVVQKYESFNRNLNKINK